MLAENSSGTSYKDIDPWFFDDFPVLLFMFGASVCGPSEKALFAASKTC